MKTVTTMAILAMLTLSAGQAAAGPPAHAGHGKGDGGHHVHREVHRDVHRGAEGRRGDDIRIDIHFSDRDRVVIRDYYHRHHAGRGFCPPGLAKKRNGCMPPGLARDWRIGERLPRSVTYYDLPPDLVVRLSRDSAGYRYVRIGADILKIAVGTGLIVDAIEDLGRL